ncbi:MAG: hypothetical protein ACLRY8_07365, partial [Clostridium butyricum]
MKHQEIAAKKKNLNQIKIQMGRVHLT